MGIIFNYLMDKIGVKTEIEELDLDSKSFEDFIDNKPDFIDNKPYTK